MATYRTKTAKPEFAGSSIEAMGSSIEVTSSEVWYYSCGLGVAYSVWGAISRIGNMTICNSTVASRALQGTGIGAGWADAGTARMLIGSLVISDSHLDVLGSGSAPDNALCSCGLGAGQSSYSGVSRVDYIRIWNSTVIARAEPGPGIGTGLSYSDGDGATSSIGSLLISDSMVDASSAGQGSGIGTGLAHSGGVSVIDTIAVSRSRLIARPGPGYAAIGTGISDSPVGSILFMGNCFVECQGSENLAAILASTILIAAASLTIVTDNAPLFGTSPINSQSSDLVIGYHETTTENSEPFLPTNGAFLHVGHVNISDSLLAVFQFCIKRIGFGHCFNESLGPIRSVILGTGGEGPHSFPAWIGNVSGDLVASDGRKTFAIDSNHSFVDVLSFPPSPSCCFTRSAPLLDSITLLKKSIALSADVSGPAEGDAATRIILIAIACLALLLIVGAIVLVRFRRRPASLKDSEGDGIEGEDSLTLVCATINGCFDSGPSGGPEVM